MVNTGRSSTGCFACKERKVKCDEQKPSCKKCLNIKRECPGYKDSWATMHREENDHAAKLVQIRVKRKLRERRDQNQSERPVLPRPVQLSVDVVTLNHFYNDYSLGSGVGFLGILPSIYSAGPATCFLDAIHATAFASSSRQRNESALMMEARRRYGRAIVGLNNSLQSPGTNNSDCMLAALFLLGLFEAIISQPSPNMPIDTEASCHPHSRGGLSLLQYRARMGLDNQLDRTVIKFFSHVALMEFFMTPPGYAPLWSELQRFRTPWANGPNLEPVIRRAVDLKAVIETRIFHPGPPSDPANTADLMHQGMEVIKDLKIAADTTSAEQESRTATAFNGLFNVANKVVTTIATCLYLTVRQQVIELMLSLMITIEDETTGDDELGGLSQQGVQNLKEICECIKIAFGIDGQRDIEQETPGHPLRIWCMLWPMGAVVASCLADEETKSWARRQFREIGKQTGFGLAMAVG
ncbi:hypothetical protein CkaCkLH20_09288 [Colletotrichum karsti]|uniref:Zn(2)-C6 fungal-type domain-containing protein n=1 Tax=Colletotrichum karsti TaxID=1095194 RepID=A0A9P6HZQ4_9PEZI|nr:uncharacterized protein CkaCkLH20_09288 [Colletotrichum karsti]KAF9873125.1 hypothetical protein CkaCkLH20_09288 [Colletotrichum karsti]